MIKGHHVYTLNHYLKVLNQKIDNDELYLKLHASRNFHIKAKLFVGTDGGLHHAAAALGIPSVVIWTGFTSPRHLGYDTHRNIHDGSEPCGTFHSVCSHCLLKAKNISVEQVLDAVNTEWYRTQR